MKQIWKYKIEDHIEQISIPKDAEILTVQIQRGVAHIWALVDPSNEKEDRIFEAIQTGSDINSDNGISRKYIGTFQLNDNSMLLVYHLFERI